MLELEVRKFGKALGALLPKELTQRFNLAAGDRLFLTESLDGTFQLSHSDAEFERQMKIAKGIMARDRNTLRVLVK